MSLESNIQNLIDNFALNAPDPKQSHPWNLNHLHADFIELKSMLWDKDSILTIQDVISHYKDFNIDIGVKKSPLLSDQVSNPNSEINDAWQSKMLDIFEVIEERVIIYENDYPFEISKNAIKLKNELNIRQKLLVSSNFTNFSVVKPILTSEFETISRHLLEDFFSSLHVIEFGQNSEFSGNTQKKIKELSKLKNSDNSIFI